MSSSSQEGVLGKGLNALLPSEEEREGDRAPEDRSGEGGGDLSQSTLYRFKDEDRMVGRVAEVEVSHIRPNPYQPRQEFSDETLDELAESIGQLGIIQPITVRALGEGQFEVISGERRLRAARRAGLERLPAYVRDAGTEEMLEMALVENVQREELNPIEVALGYQRLIEEVGLTQAQVAEKVSKNRATISNFLRLLRLPPRVQAALRDGSVSVGHARALITLDEEPVQRRLLRAIEEEDLTVRAVEERVRAHRASDDSDEEEDEAEHASRQASASGAAPSGTEAARPAAQETAAPSREEQRQEQMLKEYTDRLRSALSTQVEITHDADDEEGQIRIDYYSAEDLERLLDLLA
ncbi:MAG: chromosome partitioning protein ParB [Bacteroidetes bacterium QS_9_68_14]|nr:MAG: chromosome partitioning protein ParB [Bacteroidetes bacterium QS_9_68_14]